MGTTQRKSVIRSAFTLAFFSLAPVLILAVGSDTALAVGDSAGPEIEVASGEVSNLTTEARSIARAPDGSFVVVWRQEQGGVQGSEILGRRYSSNGTALGDAFVVNGYSTGVQREPSVAIADDGSFVVVWSENSFRDGTFLSVFGRVYDDTGAPLGGDFAIPSFTENAQESPDVAMTSDGKFVVVWSTTAQGQAPYSGIAARLFDADGSAVGAEFKVETYTTGSQRTPVVALDSDGKFVVAWSSGDYDPGPDGSRSSISARLFDAQGTAESDEFVVNQTTANYQSYPDVSRNAGGQFIVAWHDQVSESAYTARVFARKYDASGSPLTDEIEVEITPDASLLVRNTDPGVAIDSSGRFVVAWSQYNFDASNPGYIEGTYSIRAKCFTAAGAAESAEFAPPSTETGATATAVDSDPEGNFIVVWSLRGGGDSPVQARAYDREAGATTTTTIVETTTTTVTTTSTTMPSGQACGDPVVDAGSFDPLRAAIITASDALFILNAAVGLQSCEPCICDVTGEGSVTASDALRLLSAAVGIDVTLDCPPCDP